MKHLKIGFRPGLGVAVLLLLASASSLQQQGAQQADQLAAVERHFRLAA